MSTKIGFNLNENIPECETIMREIPNEETPVIQKCLVEIKFPDVYKPYTYYNDSFNLKIGDRILSVRRKPMYRVSSTSQAVILSHLTRMH